MSEVEEGGGPAIVLPYPTATAAFTAVAPAVAGLAGVLRGVLFEGCRRGCEIAATNGESTVVVRMPRLGGLDEGQRVVLDHQHLTDLMAAAVTDSKPTQRGPLTASIRLAPEGPLLTVDEQTVPVKQYSAEEVAKYPARKDDLPVVTDVADVATADFKVAVQRAVAATTTKDAEKPHLRGVLVDLTTWWLTIVGSDRWWLVAAPVAATPAEDCGELPPRVLVDGATLAAVAKQFTADRVTIGWAQEEAGVVMSFTCGDVTLWTRQVHGEFPDYRELVTPKDAPWVRVDRALLATAAVRAKAFAVKERSGSSHVIVTFDRKTVMVRPQLRERPEAARMRPLGAETGGLAGPLALRFDGVGLTAAVKSMGTEKVAIHLGWDDTPTILTEVGGSGVRCAVVGRLSQQEAARVIASAA